MVIFPSRWIATPPVGGWEIPFRRSPSYLIVSFFTATPTSAEAGLGGSDQVDSRGSFRIDGLDEGEYTVRVSHTGYQEVSRTVYLGSAIENFDVRLSPTEGQ